MPGGRAGIIGAVLIPRLLLIPALVALVVVVPSARANSPTRPDHDAFYTYSGARPLADVPPGTVVKKRSTRLAFGPMSTPIRAEQLLYRTTGQLGQPTVTVTTLLAPAQLPRAQTNIVGYLSFYDGLGAKCDPSYTLSGGNAGGAAEQEAEEEELLVSWYLSQGFVVTIPDFEGTNLDWMAGHESGYGALDAIRATESYLHTPTAQVGLSGYSGGAVAADWASELAPSYAPELDIVGVAEGGVPVNYFHLFAYADGTDVYSAAIPGMLLGLARAYHLDLGRYLSPYGAKVVRQESGECLPDLFGRYPGLTVRKLLKPHYRDWPRVPALARILREQTMGTAPGHPRAPLLMGVGNSDGRGDGVMDAADVQALADAYCRQGVPVQFEEYQGASHESAGAFFEPKTGPFLQERFAGVPFSGNCP
ncbi:MAG: hypothetical protein QOJ03_324 [Frankiaceae bacterium]|jgi:hypothetical protein|nr:hypothetical protein [Frankiaceae bacterium]